MYSSILFRSFSRLLRVNIPDRTLYFMNSPAVTHSKVKLIRSNCKFNSTESTSAKVVEVEELQTDTPGIFVIALNRPPAAKNAINRNLALQMESAVKSIQTSSNTRVVILKSNIRGIFCVGADLKERTMMKEEDIAPFLSRARQVVADMSDLPVPVIAAIDGIALGGGLEIALGCDMRIAADDAKIGLVETRLAVIPGGGGTQRLPRLIGIAKAKEMIFCAKVLSGKEALEIGLAEYSVEQNEDGNAAYLKAIELAREIANKGPVAIKLAKKAINTGAQTDLSTALKVEESCYAQVIPTEDRLEGLKAFQEKRPPQYKGK
ncbi:methylglutaconyl-CoA hydratase, mitochondrial-like isoform X1 [Dysidea avara]|uniref:methylglutaconyl-CoA hydratase, mitochondrial-like isoform X1 n=1 Tax=Dysidea avara TaxID=196820 RepID=UPI00331AD183